MLPPLRRLVEQRNVAYRDLQGLRDVIADWQTALVPFMATGDEIGSKLPSGQDMATALATARERDADRCRRKSEALINEALAHRDQARHERDDALGQRDQVRHERDDALAQRDQARQERDEAVGQRDQARQERDEALMQRDLARHKRDDARAMMDLVSADNAVLARELATLRQMPLAPLVRPAP